MELFESVPVWILAGLIFSFRVIDVSLGTVRTLMTVQGRIGTAFMLGFIEICIWTMAIAQVITNVADHPLLVVAYAGGFASGNALGIVVERDVGELRAKRAPASLAAMSIDRGSRDMRFNRPL